SLARPQQIQAAKSYDGVDPRNENLQKRVFTRTARIARAECRAGLFAATTHRLFPVHQNGRISMQTAGCTNERPLFRPCSLQGKYLPQRVEAQTTSDRRQFGNSAASSFAPCSLLS